MGPSLRSPIARRIAAALAVVAGLLACTGDRSPALSEKARALAESLALRNLPPPPPSPNNPWADDEDAAQLGHRLFFDPRLSASGTVSCATCHDPAYRFTEPSATARGVRALPRRTPTLVGAAWLPFLHWDGRKDSLWSQALGPLENPDEQGGSRLAVARVLADHYAAEYEAVFGPLPALDEAGPAQARPVPDAPEHPHHRAWEALDPALRAAIDGVFVNAGRAIEAYLRRLSPGPSPADAFLDALESGDPDGGGHLSDAARRGLSAFVGGAGCIHCHNGPLLSDRAFHNLGLPPVPGVPDDDPGRAAGALAVHADPFRCGGPHAPVDDCPELRFLDTDAPELVGAFKTPSLRDVAARPPYMHAGQLKDLPAVLSFYRTLPGDPAVGRRAKVLHAMDPTVGSEDLVAFLEALTGPMPEGPWHRPPEPSP